MPMFSNESQDPNAKLHPNQPHNQPPNPQVQHPTPSPGPNPPGHTGPNPPVHAGPAVVLSPINEWAAKQKLDLTPISSVLNTVVEDFNKLDGMIQGMPTAPTSGEYPTGPYHPADSPYPAGQTNPNPTHPQVQHQSAGYTDDAPSAQHPSGTPGTHPLGPFTGAAGEVSKGVLGFTPTYPAFSEGFTQHLTTIQQASRDLREKVQALQISATKPKA